MIIPPGSLGHRIDELLRRGLLDTVHERLAIHGGPRRRGRATCRHVSEPRWADLLLTPPPCLSCDPTDGSIAAGLAAGDDRAFQLLVERETASVFRICYRLHGSRSEAEEAARHGFAAAYRGLATYSEDQPPRAWIALVVVRDAWQRRLDRLSEDRVSGVQIAWDAQPTADEKDPEHDGLDPQERVQVRLAVASMPKAEREAVMLTFYAGLSLAEIAAVSGRSAVDTKAHLEGGLERVCAMARESRS